MKKRFFADILLTPLEATRIRLVSNPKFASGLATGFAKLAAEGGVRELYAGFIPILFKQIPYALGQFTVSEVAFTDIRVAHGCRACYNRARLLTAEK